MEEDRKKKKKRKIQNILLHVLLQNTAGFGQKLQPDTGLPTVSTMQPHRGDPLSGMAHLICE